MAKAVLAKYQPLVIGITGSVGKSSAKEAIALVLSASYRVRSAEGNQNNEIGIPLTIIGAKSGGRSVFRWLLVFFRWAGTMLFPIRFPQVLVLEMGIDRPGDMEYLLNFVPVNIGVVTQVSSSHIAYFGSVGNIAKEKGRLIAELPENGYAILNADDKNVIRMQERTRAKIITYGFSESASVRADHILFHRDPRRMEGFSFKVAVEGKSVPVRLPKIIAKHHIFGVLSAIGVGLSLKMNLVEIARALERFEPLPGRLRLLPGREGAFLLDDTYNASPVSVRAALDVVKELMAPRKIVVLGDMLELGADATEEHGGLAEVIEASGAHIIFTVGQHMRSLHEALLARGYARKRVLWMPDPISALEALLQTIRPDDLILIKGSRGMRMEKIVEGLLIDPRDAKALLCCQSDEWRRKPFAPPSEWTEII